MPVSVRMYYSIIVACRYRIPHLLILQKRDCISNKLLTVRGRHSARNRRCVGFKYSCVSCTRRMGNDHIWTTEAAGGWNQISRIGCKLLFPIRTSCSRWQLARPSLVDWYRLAVCLFNLCFFETTYHPVVSLLTACQRGPFKPVFSFAASASLSTHTFIKTRPRRVLNNL